MIWATLPDTVFKFKAADVEVGDQGASQLLERLRTAQKDASTGVTLATLLDDGMEI
jgi:hypothetical protein